MRIALFSHFYPPLSNAGAEQYTHGLARELIARGHEVRVLCVGNWQTGKTYFQGWEDREWEGVPVRRLHLNWTLAPDPNGYLIDNPVTRDQAKRFLEEFRPEVVHITSLYSFSSSVLESIQALNIPILFTLTDYWIICNRHTLLRGNGNLCDGRVTPDTCRSCLLHDTRPYQILKSTLGETLTAPITRWISHTHTLSNQPGFLGLAVDIERRQALLRERLPYVDIFISPSQYVADQCRIDGFPDEILLSRHGMKLDWLKSYQHVPAAEGQIRLGYLGQINALKGVDVLVSEFINGNFGCQLTLSIHGRLDQTPDYSENLRQMAQGHPHIQFAGPYLRDELGQVLAEMDVLVVPSIWAENAPLVVQEAFAAKIPVIASNLGGLPEFVHHNENGLLFDPRKPGSLLAQLQRLRQEGSGLLERLRAGIPKVLTIAEELQHLLQLYQSAIEARHASQA